MYFHVLRISNPGRLRFAAVAADRVDVLNNRRLTAVLPCALAALLVVAAACSTSVSGPGGAASNGTSSGSTATGTGAPAKAWVADDLHVVSQVAATDQEALVTAEDKDGTLEGTALDTATGKVLWQHANTPADGIQGVGILAPAPVKRSGGWLAVEIEDAGGKVALGDPYAYVARDSRTGKQVWRHPVSDTSTFIPCGNLFCFDTLDDQYAGTLVAVDPETGKTRWTYAASNAVHVRGGRCQDDRHRDVGHGDDRHRARCLDGQGPLDVERSCGARDRGDHRQRGGTVPRGETWSSPTSTPTVRTDRLGPSPSTGAPASGSGRPRAPISRSCSSSACTG